MILLWNDFFSLIHFHLTGLGFNLLFFTDVLFLCKLIAEGTHERNAPLATIFFKKLKLNVNIKNPQTKIPTKWLQNRACHRSFNPSIPALDTQR